MNNASGEELVLRGGQALMADWQWHDAPLGVAQGLIGKTHTGRWLDTRDCHVLPGIVDFHGDAFERQIMPRPNVHFPLDVAMLDTDRQLAANGITTAMHGLTYSWEGGLRGRDTAVAMIAMLGALKERLAVDHRVHLRYECHNLDGEDDALGWLRDGRIGLLAFNDHLPGMNRRRDNVGKMREYAERAGTDVAGFIARMDAAAARAAEVPALVARLAQLAAELGVPMASHDDHLVAERTHFHAMQCRIAEFPLNREVAQCARALGDDVVCGGPNILRGGSHVGAPRAADLVGEGLANIIASDYYYPAPLNAAYRLAHDGVCDIAQAWQCVSHTPARALGLHDRGALAEGLRADIIVVEFGKGGKGDDRPQPRVVATVSAGKLVYLADGARLHG